MEGRLTNEQQEVFFDAMETLFPDEDDGLKLDIMSEEGTPATSLESNKTDTASSHMNSYPEMMSSSLEVADAETNHQSCSAVAATSAAAEKASTQPEERMYCYCKNCETTRSARQDVVTSAVRKYKSNELDLETLVNLLRSQPCSEDVIVAFDELAWIFEVKESVVDVVREFGQTRGFHSGATPLMSACRYHNESLMEMLLLHTDTNVNATDFEDCTPLHHICCAGWGAAWGDGQEPRTMAERLRQCQRSLQANGAGLSLYPPAQNFPGCFLPRPPTLPDDDHAVRRNQSRLCQLAFTHSHTQLDELSSLFDQEITLRCCHRACKFVLFSHVDPSYYENDPLVIFEDCWANNRELFLSIERGQCPCSRNRKTSISFLPACAAAAAGNFELFRRMLKSLVNRVQMYSARRCHGDRCHGDVSSVLKVGGAACYAERAKPRKQLRFDLSLAVFHSDRLLVQALYHVMYAKKTREVLRVLDDPQIQSAIPLTDDSKISLMHMSLQLGDDSLFWDLLDKFGLDIQSDCDGLTPLMLLVMWGEREMARALLRRGAQRGAVTTMGENALKMAFQMEDEEESTKMVIMLLEEGEGQADPKDPHGPSALRLAIRYNRYVVLDYLLEQGDISVPEVSRYKKAGKVVEQVLWQPAVSWCTVRSAHYSVARYLIDKGLDCFTPVVLNLNETVGDSRTPLQALSGQTSKEAVGLVELLLEKGADVNERTHMGFTPLVLAVKFLNYKVIAKLICAGAILDSFEPSDLEENGEAVGGSSESGSASIQNGSGSVSTQNESRSTSALNGSGTGSIRDGSESTSMQNTSSCVTSNSGSAQMRNGSGAISPQNSSESLLHALYPVPIRRRMENASFLWHALKQQHYIAAQMAVVAGYRVHREPWYTSSQFPPLTPLDLIQSLQKISEQPMTLLNLCRRTLRENVGSRLSEYLRLVRPSQPVADFITMKDLVEVYLECAESGKDFLDMYLK